MEMEMTSQEIQALHHPNNPLEAKLGIELCYQLALLNEQAAAFWGPISLDIHALILNECQKRRIGTRYRATQGTAQSETVSD